MHICEVIKTLDVGGAEVLLVSRLLAAPDTGKRYTVACLQASTDELINRLQARGIEVIDLTEHPRHLRLLRLAQAIKSLRADVLNIHSPLPAALLRPVSYLWRPRPTLISTVHNVRYRVPTRVLEQLTSWLDDRTVAVCPQVARSTAGWGTRATLDTRIHGVDVTEQRRHASEGKRTRDACHVRGTDFLIVHAANLRPQKNHGLLIEAAARVVETDSRAMFLLVGTGPLRDQVAQRVAAVGSGNVRFLGHVPEAGRLIACADLLVLSSDYEGLPVVVMEALAAGVPVVSTAVGGVPDLIEHDSNGLLTPPGDAEALATAILRAMQPKVHERLRRGARNSAHSVDIARTAEWFDKLYDQIGVRA
jgi:glycosyltransferase involved in cell wall biosynthesis